MEVTRAFIEREGCYNFYLKEGDQILTILFGGNLDLYWNLYKYKENIQDYNIKDHLKERIETFVITKENYFIYSLFEELYEDIKNSKIFLPIKKETTEYEEDDEEDDFDIWKNLSEDELNKKNQAFKEREYYQKLFDGETIIWHSDDEEYNVADRVKIHKEEDNFVLEFIRPQITTDKLIYRPLDSISIRFRNSGSTYDPYNMIFMRMFNKLQEYDPDYHQIHIEELTYRKTLKK